MKRIIATLIASLAVTLTGCGATKTISDNESTAQGLLGVATLYVIERSADRPAKAIALIKAAEEIRKFVDFDGVTVDDLVAKARERIAQSDAELSEKAGLNLLLSRAEGLIREKVDSGELDPEAKATVNKLLDWIIVAAQAYAG